MADATLTPLQQVQDLLIDATNLTAMVDGAVALLRAHATLEAGSATTLLGVVADKLDDHWASIDQLRDQLQAKEVAHG